MVALCKRAAIIDWFLTNNTRYHLTLTFSHCTPQPVCLAYLNKLFKQLNRAIYKKRYAKGLSFLQGFAVQEYTNAINTYHYHILISDDACLPDKDRFDDLIQKQLTYLKRYGGKHYITHHLLQHYTNDGTNRLEHYLTKQFEFGGSKSSNRVGWLSDTSIHFGDMT